MPRACLDINASNYGFNRNGEFDENAEIHDPGACEYAPGMEMDEEAMAQSVGNTEYTTHDEATERGDLINTDRDRNRAGYVESQKTTEKRNATLILGGLVLYYFFGGF